MSKVAKLRELATRLIEMTREVDKRLPEDEPRQFEPYVDRADPLAKEYKLTLEDLSDELGEYYDPEIRRLNREQIESLRRYKAGQDAYYDWKTDVEWENELRRQRGQSQKYVPTLSEWMNLPALRSAVQQLPRMPVNAMVYRGMPQSAHNLHGGTKTPDFLSTTFDPDVAPGFGRLRRRYLVPEGSPGVGMEAEVIVRATDAEGEHEILLPIRGRGAENFELVKMGNKRKPAEFLYRPPYKARGGAVRKEEVA